MDEKRRQHQRSRDCRPSAPERIVGLPLFWVPCVGGRDLIPGAAGGQAPSSAWLRSSISEEQLGLSFRRRDRSELVLRPHQGPFRPVRPGEHTATFPGPRGAGGTPGGERGAGQGGNWSHNPVPTRKWSRTARARVS